MSSVSGLHDERPRRRSRVKSEVAAPEESVVAPTAHFPAVPPWTLDSNVKDVLLRGASPPENVKLSAFLRTVGGGFVSTEDVYMSFFILAPQKYIPDKEQLAKLVKTLECTAYELFYMVVPFLERKGISTLRHWADRGRGVRPSPSDNIRDDIWNVATVRLNKAADSIKRPIPDHDTLVHRTREAFLHGDATIVLVRKLKYLGRGPWDSKKSALAELNESKLRLQWSEWLPTAGNGFIGRCECSVLYKRAVPNYPVVHGLFFVEGHGTPGGKAVQTSSCRDVGHKPKTIVLLHATKQRRNRITTGALLNLKKKLKDEFEDWDDFSKNMRWEIVYVQHPDTQLFDKRQQCKVTEVERKDNETDEQHKARKIAHDAEQIFWETEVDQYAVKVDNALLKSLSSVLTQGDVC
ncbi:hypothetical protein ERJ75_001552800 [Trypanosoma vivax]|nr:hypothetical protein ERJ75_001552800 [Trypanosoma vivax]